MLHQILIGTVLITATVLIHAGFIVISIAVIRRVHPFGPNHPQIFKTFTTLSAVCLWLMLAHSLEVWLWAGCFLYLGTFNAVESAVYFALIVLTTVGFGDIILPDEWRILSGLAGANGLILFGFSTAYLIEVLLQLRQIRTSR